MADLLLARADDDHPGLRSGDGEWTWRELVAEAAVRAAWLAAGPPLEPPHVAILLGNVPEFLHWLGAAALAGATVVGVNSTRRGEALAGDLRRTDCRLVVTDRAGRELLAGLDTGVPADRVLVVDDPATAEALEPHRDADPRAVAARAAPTVDDLYLLLFTSGTTGDPKAVRCTQGRLAAIGANAAAGYGYQREDVAYCSMPLFHGNSLMALWAPTLTVGGTVALVPRFSASGFIDDVHRYGVTMFTYVGKALSYVLATAPRPDDAACPLRRGFGTEASLADLAAFQERFRCRLLEGYGSSEGGANIVRTPDTPVGALGPAQGDMVVLDPETLRECPPARFDVTGRLTNPGEAIGEIVNRDGAPRFEGYYANDQANADKLRHGWYWTGDLAYRDEAGFFYFAGRGGDWLRVDSENLTAGPIERVLVRHPDVAAVAVYGVPDPRSGDQVMAALELLPGRSLDPEGLGAFLEAQDDLGTKWPPAFVRLTHGLPQTASGKATKDPLRRQGWWACDDPVLVRIGPGLTYAPLDGEARDRLRAQFADHGRAELLER
jgi:fatty-acyl-CoA synthase